MNEKNNQLLSLETLDFSVNKKEASNLYENEYIQHKG